MPIISGGYLSLAGGTLSGPLTITPNDGNVIPLSIRASWNAQNQDFFSIVNTDSGIDFVAVNSLGDLAIVDKTTGGERQTLPQQNQSAKLRQGYAAQLLTSGALPTLAFVSGTALQQTQGRDVFICVPFTGDATNNAATLKIELSPDNVTFSILDTLSIAAALNLTGALNVPVTFAVPSLWWVKLTATHGTIGTGTYY